MPSSALAIDGGPRVRDRPWPPWPKVTEQGEVMLLEAFHSGRWTVSGAYTGSDPYERRFAEAYARFHEIPYCVPTCHGSSALVTALEALGLGAGDEVLVPGLTWVACASAVAGIGAVPVLVDVDDETLCMSVAAAEAAITERTAAILVVHLFCSAADLDAFVALADRRGLALLEDCSQAHGARWHGRRVGTFGTVSAFSFQQTKLLTAGEGGATLTSDATLFDRMEQLRADGRRYVDEPRLGHLDLEEIGTVQGRNYCMTEFQAALLLEGLTRLDDENDLRRANAEQLDVLLRDVEGIRIQGCPDGLDERTYYHLCLRIDPAAFADRPVDYVAAALSAELDLGAVEPVDDPMNANRLYDPLRSPRTRPEERRLLDPSRFELPAARDARRTHLTVPHRALLGAESDVADIAEALDKIRRHAAAPTAVPAGR